MLSHHRDTVIKIVVTLVILMMKSESNLKSAIILSPETDHILGNKSDPKYTKNKNLIWILDSEIPRRSA